MRTAPGASTRASRVIAVRITQLTSDAGSCGDEYGSCLCLRPGLAYNRGRNFPDARESKSSAAYPPNPVPIPEWQQKTNAFKTIF